ncbi:MAG: tetratricopeptide repeat protein [Chloroflexi bacterium]|nr:tetratricopeptide repeat protein [Chloroflexota bacterium]
MAQSAGRVVAGMVLLFTLFLAACGAGESPAATPIAFQLPATLPPTPTLVGDFSGAAPAIAPTPPVTPRAGEMDPAAPTATARVVGTPTATPLPQERLALADAALAEANAAAAIEQFLASLALDEGLTEAEKQEALYNLGVAYLQDEKFAEAAEAFNQRLEAGASCLSRSISS